MANVDTGLGWYAETEWLTDSPGIIGSLESGGGSGGGGCPEVYNGFSPGGAGGYQYVITQVSGTAPVYCGSFKEGGNTWTPLLFSSAPFTLTQTGGNGIGDWGLVNGWYAKEIYGKPGNYTSCVPVYTQSSSTNLRSNAIAYLTSIAPSTRAGACPEVYNGFTPGGIGNQTFRITQVSGTSPVYCGSFKEGSNAWTPLLFSSAPFTFAQTGGNGIGDWGLVDGWYAKEIYGFYGDYVSCVPVYTQGSSTSLRNNAIAYLTSLSPSTATVNFAKSTSGYSVVCMCKWITSYGGNIYCSPVLISNQQNNTLYTRDGSTPSVNTTEHQYQGMTFYMRKAPLDTLTGTETITSAYPLVDLSGVAQTNDTIFSAIAYQSNLTVGQVDPYSGAGESEPGAEDATFDFDSTAIDFGTPPTITAAGMVELYIPSTNDLASLAQYLWAGSFDPDNFKKLFADPMDAIIGLQIVPVTATEIGTSPDTLYVGNISTGLSMPKASRQYVPVDCGSLSIPRRLGSYLDYSPHTEMQLYLPYIGFVDISPDDCMGGTVSVKYMVDIIGGTCVAQVKCNNHVLYEYAAACSCQVPVSAGQYQNIVLGAVRGGVGLVSGILGAAGGGLFSGLSEAADAAMSMTKPKIQRSGGFGGSSGLMGHQTPYIIYTVPRLIVPGRQNNFIGYPSYITRTLGDLTGFTQIDSIHLSGIPASQSEQAEIEQLLQEGVYL